GHISRGPVGLGRLASHLSRGATRRAGRPTGVLREPVPGSERERGRVTLAWIAAQGSATSGPWHRLLPATHDARKLPVAVRAVAPVSPDAHPAERAAAARAVRADRGRLQSRQPPPLE